MLFDWEKMDEKLRELERKYRETGSIDDGFGYFKEAIRAGKSEVRHLAQLLRQDPNHADTQQYIRSQYPSVLTNLINEHVFPAYVITNYFTGVGMEVSLEGSASRGGAYHDIDLLIRGDQSAMQSLHAISARQSPFTPEEFGEYVYDVIPHASGENLGAHTYVRTVIDARYQLRIGDIVFDLNFQDPTTRARFEGLGLFDIIGEHQNG